MHANRGVDKVPSKHYTTTSKTLSVAKPNTFHLLPQVQPKKLKQEMSVNAQRNTKVSVMALNHKLLSKGA